MPTSPSPPSPEVPRPAAPLADAGRLVVGFGAERGYPFDEFRDNAEAAGLVLDLEVSTWDLRPFGEESEFLISVLSRPASSD